MQAHRSREAKKAEMTVVRTQVATLFKPSQKIMLFVLFSSNFLRDRENCKILIFVKVGFPRKTRKGMDPDPRERKLK